MRRVLFWAVEAAILLGVWFLYVDKLSKDELAAGLIAAALAATGSEVVRGLNFARFYPHARYLAQVRRVPGMILEGCWILLKVLLLRAAGKDIRGEVKSMPFQAGGDDNRASARRALAVLFTTLAPNFIVIDIDRGENRMVYHQVLGNEVPLLTRELGSEP